MRSLVVYHNGKTVGVLPEQENIWKFSYANESAGALNLLEYECSLDLPTGRRRLTNEQLSQRIRNLPRSSLQKDSPKRMSLAGAQHKMLIDLGEDEIYEPEAGTSSTYILKPNHPGPDYSASVMNEHSITWFAGEMVITPANRSSAFKKWEDYRCS
jgi:serine/threonine-protein kinase HipA